MSVAKIWQHSYFLNISLINELIFFLQLTFTGNMIVTKRGQKLIFKTKTNHLRTSFFNAVFYFEMVNSFKSISHLYTGSSSRRWNTGFRWTYHEFYETNQDKFFQFDIWFGMDSTSLVWRVEKLNVLILLYEEDQFGAFSLLFTSLMHLIAR